MERHLIEAVGDVLILAGDIMSYEMRKQPSAFLDFIEANFEMTYWIPGNHEFYDYDLATVPDPLLEKVRSNIWMVNNQVVTYNNINFICSTLWSKINPVNALDIQRSIPDFHSIQWEGKRFTTRQFNQLHNQSVAFLEKAFRETKGSKSIVVTHHVPTLYQYPEKYRNSPLNEAFVTELYDTIHDSGAAYWVYGHHHSNVPEYSVGETKMVTNQLGYVQRAEHRKFDGKMRLKV